MTFWLSAALLLWVSHTRAQWACPNTQHIITGVSVDLEWNWIDVDGELDDFELGKDLPWIQTNNMSDQRYFTLFGDDGSPLVELENTHKLRKIIDRQLRKPIVTDEETKTGTNPNYVFSIGYNNEDDCLNLFTPSGRRLFATEDKTVSTSLPSVQGELSNSSDLSACWNIKKWNQRFLMFESKKFENYFWRSSQSGDIALVSTCEVELFSGFKTNFILETKLEVSNSTKPESLIEFNIEDDHYGEIVVKYYNPKGVIEEGYICDNKWDTEDANNFCHNHWPGQFGMPTSDGYFSGHKAKVNYALSCVDCSRSDSFVDCPFKTKCSDNNKFCQNTVSLYNGKGFGCSSGADNDIAGVVCGNSHQVDGLRKEDYTCKKGRYGNVKKSIASMVNLQQQAKTAGEKLMKNKHWSEYLLPIPMTISLVSMLALISAQFKNVVKFEPPSDGAWEHLKYDTYQPNLEKLQSLMLNSFETSHESMMRINSNSKRMNIQLKNAVNYASLDQDTPEKVRAKKLLLNNAMVLIKDWANENFEKAELTIQKFDLTDQFILELVEALKGTKKFSKSELRKLEQWKAKMEEEIEKKEYEKKRATEELKALKANETSLRDQLANDAVSVLESMCMMEDDCNAKGSKECNCVYREGYEDKNNCILKEPELRCVKEEDFCLKEKDVCTKFVPVCTKFDQVCKNDERVCKKSESVCKINQEKCQKLELKCMEQETICADYENVCKKMEQKCNGGKSECAEQHQVCVTEFWGVCYKRQTQCKKYSRNPRICEGVCTGGFKSECKKQEQKCKSYKEVCAHKEMECVEYEQRCFEHETKCTKRENECIQWEQTCNSTKTICEEKEVRCAQREPELRCQKYQWIQPGYFCQEKGEWGGCCGGCNGANKIGETLKMVTQHSLLLETNQNLGVQGNSDILAILSVTEKNLKEALNIVESFDSDTIIEDTEKNQTIPTIMELSNDDKKILSNDLFPYFQTFVKILPMQITQLSTIAVNNPLAKKSAEIYKSLKPAVDGWAQSKGELSDENIQEMEIFKEKIQSEMKEINAALVQTSVDPMTKTPDIGLSRSAVAVWKTTDTLLQVKTDRMRADNKAQLLTDVLEQKLYEMKETSIEVDDYKQTVKFLVESSEYLKKLSQVWGEIKTFFRKVRELLNGVIQNSKLLKMNTDTLVLSPAETLNILMENVREAVVGAYSQNLYMIKVSDFYNEILEKGLLKEIRSINFESCDEENCVQRMKDYVFNDCKATKAAIKEKIRIDEGKLNKQMTNEVGELRNHLICMAQKDPELGLTGEINQMTDKMKELKQNKKIAEAISTVDPKNLEETLEMYADDGEDDLYSNDIDW